MNFKGLVIIKYLVIIALFISTISTTKIARAAETFVTLHMVDEQGIGKEIGTVKVEGTEYGLLLTPNLTDIPSGIHGFHLHENPSCEPGIKDGEIEPGLAAGGHYDPENTQSHQGPYGEGHLGDLPPLVADEEENVNLPILAPRLQPSALEGHSLIVHRNGDNFSDIPKTLGGGGARLACGVIE